MKTNPLRITEKDFALGWEAGARVEAQVEALALRQYHQAIASLVASQWRWMVFRNTLSRIAVEQWHFMVTVRRAEGLYAQSLLSRGFMGLRSHLLAMTHTRMAMVRP